MLWLLRVYWRALGFVIDLNFHFSFWWFVHLIISVLFLNSILFFRLSHKQAFDLVILLFIAKYLSHDLWLISIRYVSIFRVHKLRNSPCGSLWFTRHLIRRGGFFLVWRWFHITIILISTFKSEASTLRVRLSASIYGGCWLFFLSC